MSYIVSTASLQSRLALLEAAYNAVLTGQSYSIDGKQLTRADAKWISEEMGKIEQRLSRRLNKSNSRVDVVLLER